MRCLFSKVLLSAAMTGFLSIETFASHNVESIRLEPVILNSAAKCNRLLFRSSLHFQGTVFMMPQVIIGKGPEGFHGYNIIPSDVPGKYTLNLNLYFPKNDESLRAATASEVRADQNICNTDYIMADLNHNLTDPTMMVSRIGNIPIRSIEIEIKGISTTGKIGRIQEQDGDVDILDYQSGFLTASFDINETEKTLFETRVRDSEGLPAILKFEFQARSSTGALKVSLNTNDLQRNFAANVKGKVGLTEDEVGIALKSALSTVAMNVDSEAGSDEFNKMSDQIISAVLSEITSHVRPKSDLATQKSARSKGLISVQAAIEIISQKTNQDIHVQQDGGPESVKAETQINLNASTVKDSRFVTITLKAEAPDPTTGIELKSGQEITINALDWTLNKFSYDKMESHYMTVSELRNYKLDGLFKAITDENVFISQREVNGVPLAIGTKKFFFGLFTNNHVERFRWRLDSVTATSGAESMVFEPTQELIEKLPLKLSFSNVAGGQRFGFNSMFEENPYWLARFDSTTGSVVLKAKQDLGVLQIHQNMHGAKKDEEEKNIKYIGHPLVTKWAVMEYWNPLLGTRKSAPRPIAESVYQRAPILQRQIRLSITKIN